MPATGSGFSESVPIIQASNMLHVERDNFFYVSRKSSSAIAMINNLHSLAVKTLNISRFRTLCTNLLFILAAPS